MEPALKLKLRSTQLLHERCLSAAEIARRIGAHRSAVATVLNGSRRPTLELAQRIAAALHVDPEVLFREWRPLRPGRGGRRMGSTNGSKGRKGGRHA